MRRGPDRFRAFVWYHSGMRRYAPRWLTVCALVSLGIAAGVQALSAWGARREDERRMLIGVERPWNGYFLKVDGRGLRVLKMPRPGPNDEKARRWAGWLRDATWVAAFQPRDGGFYTDGSGLTDRRVLHPKSGLDLSVWQRMELIDVNRPLLDALDDPERFFGAHYLLTARHDRFDPAMWDVEVSDGTAAGEPQGITGSVFGLRVRLTGPGGPENPSRAVVANPSQLPEIRSEWRGRLARQVVGVPFWLVTLAAGTVLPGAWLVVAIRRELARQPAGMPVVMGGRGTTPAAEAGTGASATEHAHG